MDAVAELVERKSAVGKMAVCDLNTGSVSPVFRYIETEFGIRQQHHFGGVFKAIFGEIAFLHAVIPRFFGCPIARSVYLFSTIDGKCTPDREG